MTQTLAKKLKFKGSWTGGGGSMIGLSSPGADSGKFKMEIELNPNGTFTGTTQDKHGKANVEGTLTNEEINFIKEYIPGESNSNAGKIIYEHGKRGYLRPNTFKGKWHGEGPCYKRLFTLKVVG